MVENAQQMSCGGCGESDFHIYTEGQGANRRLHVQCKKCKDVTVISTERPSLQLDFGEESNSRMCVLGLKRGKNRGTDRKEDKP